MAEVLTSSSVFPTPSSDDCSGQWRVLASTNRGLEDVGIGEIDRRIDAPAERFYPGMLQFEASESDIATLHARTRSLHRLMLELDRVNCTELTEIYDCAVSLPFSAYLDETQSFAVRAKRRGTHPFTSMDVEREVGQAIIDTVREQTGRRQPVDLDDPDIIFRVFVREETVILALDLTGQQSLHRRAYRISEHEAPIRPTMAYAMYRYADPQPGDRLVDPMCGCGTIPIEAARADRSFPPEPVTSPTLPELSVLDTDPYHRARSRPTTTGTLDIVAMDHDPGAVESTTENAVAGNAPDLTVKRGDATDTAFDADLIVTDMPFGRRTDEPLEPLYRGFFDNIADQEWRRAVVHTAREDLVPLEPTAQIPMRRGRLETSLLVFE